MLSFVAVIQDVHEGILIALAFGVACEGLCSIGISSSNIFIAKGHKRFCHFTSPASQIQYFALRFDVLIIFAKFLS